MLYEKGYDNVFLLSGGIEKFLIDFPNLVEGHNIPDILKMKENADAYNKTMLEMQYKKNKTQAM